MGVAFKAEDTKRDRMVAIKSLPSIKSVIKARPPLPGTQILNYTNRNSGGSAGGPQ